MTNYVPFANYNVISYLKFIGTQIFNCLLQLLPSNG